MEQRPEADFVAGPAPAGLFAAVDACYPHAGGARAALVVFGDRAFSQIEGERVAGLPRVAPYRPGHFFLRELPAIRAVLAGISGIGLLLVDGYVDLDPRGRPGLGAYVHREFAVPVVGVAKSPFRGATHAAAVLRGRSLRPLLVTAVGLPLTDAADLVRGMAGRFRIPDALRRADALARGRRLPVIPVSGLPAGADR